MVGKGKIIFMVTLCVLLTIRSNTFSNANSESGTRAFETFDMIDLPPQDINGNYTLDEDDRWDITGFGNLEGNITMSEQSKLIITNADIHVNGTIWAKGQTSISIKNSILRFSLGCPEPVLIEKQYEGPHGFLLFEDEVSFMLDESSLYVHRYEVFQETEDGMMIPGEVIVNFGDFTVKGSYINTSSTINFGSFNQTVHRGMVMHMNCEFNFINSTLTHGIVLYVNAHGTIRNTNFKSLSAQKNTNETTAFICSSTITHSVSIDVFSNVIFNNCDLQSCLIVRIKGKVVMYNTKVRGMKLQGTGSVIMDNSQLPEESVHQDWNHVWGNASLTLLNSSFIKKLNFHDGVSLTMDNSSMNDTILTDNAMATLTGSSIDNLSAEKNATVWLQGSEIKNYTLNDNAKICNVTSLVVNTKLNLQPLQTFVELKDSAGTVLASSETDFAGKAEFALVRDMISQNQTSMEMTYSPLITQIACEAEYENLQSIESVQVNSDHVKVDLKFEDYNPPIIDDISFKIDPYLSSNNKVLVSVNVEDEETNLANIILRYSTGDDITWKNITLYNIGENVYENSIPGQSDGTKVRFYIVAEDKCGNKMESRYHSYTVGENVVIINNLIVITTFIILIGGAVLLIVKWKIDRTRVKGYLKGDNKIP